MFTKLGLLGAPGITALGLTACGAGAPSTTVTALSTGTAATTAIPTPAAAPCPSGFHNGTPGDSYSGCFADPTPAAAPLYQCLSINRSADYIVVVDEYSDPAECANVQALSALQGSPAEGLHSMPSGYREVCRWAPYTLPIGPQNGGSVWAGDITGARGIAQFHCDNEKPLAPPTPAPPCVPQTDATVQKNCG